ncbi:MAG: enoyl-CoA hydratase/isomerase family protein [Deltaproteobacteria bacterium]|nr:enoyl-CoA hydratase/isomerase family protein [Deltaproteobacteria bacterium]
MSDGTVSVERVDQVALVTLRRPDKRNALNEAMWRGLAAAAQKLREQAPRAVVVTGEGSAFCAGMDLSAENPQLAGLAQAAQTRDPGPMRELLTQLRPAIDAFIALPVPTIAAVNGLAYGGGAELATRCDLRVVDPDAEICFSEVRLGLIPDMGGCATLPRLVGRAVATDLIVTARRVKSAEALSLGLANRVSAPGKVVEEALALGRSIAQNGPRAVRAALDVIRRGADLTEDEALALERDRATEVMATGECIFGVTAVMAHQDPEFPDIDD